MISDNNNQLINIINSLILQEKNFQMNIFKDSNAFETQISEFSKMNIFLGDF